MGGCCLIFWRAAASHTTIRRSESSISRSSETLGAPAHIRHESSPYAPRPLNALACSIAASARAFAASSFLAALTSLANCLSASLRALYMAAVVCASTFVAVMSFWDGCLGERGLPDMRMTQSFRFPPAAHKQAPDFVAETTCCLNSRVLTSIFGFFAVNNSNNNYTRCYPFLVRP